VGALFESSIKSLPRLGKGKVRDIYAVGSDKMLIVASDRLSAFDVVLPDPIPDKGRVLNEMANFWFAKLGHVVPNHPRVHSDRRHRAAAGLADGAGGTHRSAAGR